METSILFGIRTDVSLILICEMLQTLILAIILLIRK